MAFELGKDASSVKRDPYDAGGKRPVYAALAVVSQGELDSSPILVPTGIGQAPGPMTKSLASFTLSKRQRHKIS